MARTSHFLLHNMLLIALLWISLPQKVTSNDWFPRHYGIDNERERSGPRGGLRPVTQHEIGLFQGGRSPSDGDNTSDKPGTIVDIAIDNPDLSCLVDLLIETDLVDALSQDGPFTVFAPNDAAFDKTWLGTMNVNMKREILLYHVVDKKILSTDLRDGARVLTLQGRKVRVSLYPVVRINNARVVEADIIASNGVIHIIDKVLMPPHGGGVGKGRKPPPKHGKGKGGFDSKGYWIGKGQGKGHYKDYWKGKGHYFRGKGGSRHPYPKGCHCDIDKECCDDDRDNEPIEHEIETHVDDGQNKLITKNGNTTNIFHKRQFPMMPSPTTPSPTTRPTPSPTIIVPDITTSPTPIAPTRSPTQAPTRSPTQAPTRAPTQAPTRSPTQAPIRSPTQAPTRSPTQAPTQPPTTEPTSQPTQAPTTSPTLAPTSAPTSSPTTAPQPPPTPPLVSNPPMDSPSAAAAQTDLAASNIAYCKEDGFCNLNCSELSPDPDCEN